MENGYSVVKWFTRMICKKTKKSGLIGIQEDAVLPVSESLPVWEAHSASGESLNAVAADE